MTRALLLMVCLFGCDDDDDSDGRPGRVDAGIVDTMPDGETCYASGNCTQGVMCGLSCCAQGERCVEGVCKCGAGPACEQGDSCVSGGPLLPSHGCGQLCCGVTMGCPI